MTVGGVTRGFGAHNAVFIPAGTMHNLQIGGQVFGSAVFFPRENALNLPETPLHLRVRDAQDQTELNQILDNLQRESESDRPGRVRAMHYLAGSISVWLERQVLDNDDALATTDAARRLSRRFAQLVESHFPTDQSVSDYASKLGVTPTHLTRVCNQIMGAPASEILARRKLAEAQRLLADTKIPVKDIASALGYHSPAYFTRLFSAKIGLSPGAFRKTA